MLIDWKDFTDASYFIKEIEVNPNWINDFGEDYHQYRKRWSNATKNYKMGDFPLCLEIESSYSCNFKCPNCPRFSTNISRTGNMSLSTFKKIIKESKERKLDSIFLDHGGESLLNKDLPEYVKLCKEAGILDIMLSTNASLLTRDISRQLIHNGLTKINFSIDAATEATYSKVRCAGLYKKVLENINIFLEEKKNFGQSYPRVRVSFIVQECNKDEVDKFYTLWKDSVNMIAYQKVKRFNDQLPNDSKLLKQPTYDFKCTQLFTTLMINHKGNIHLCNHDYNHKYKLGNITTDSINQCWHSDMMNNFRQLHEKGEWAENAFCKDCVLKSI